MSAVETSAADVSVAAREHASAEPDGGESPTRRDTPEELLRTAERLIATNGTDTVSLRQIAAEAGCKNPSVVHYHFGSRIGLLRAIIEFRTPSIDRRLRELLDMLVQQRREHDLRGLVEAMARPLLELEPESHYLAFLARLSMQPELKDEYLSMAGSTSSIPLLQQYLEVALPFLPRDVRDQRLRMTADLVVTTIANRRMREAADSRPPLPDEEFAQRLFDAMVGLLGAAHTVSG